MILYQHTTNTYSHRLKIILTFVCNFNCSYCAVKYTLWKDRKTECEVRTPEEWANAINKVEGRGIVFNGGEPTQYPGLYELLERIRPDIGVSLYTNMSFDVKDFARRVKRRMGFLLSYHPDYGAVEEFIENFKLLKEHKDFSFVIHGVKINAERDLRVERAFKEAGIPFHLERDCNEELKDWISQDHMLNPKRVDCEIKNYVFAPDGARYPCACRAYRLVGPRENICNGDPLGQETLVWKCDDFGWCHLADVKENVTIISRGDAP